MTDSEHEKAYVKAHDKKLKLLQDIRKILDQFNAFKNYKESDFENAIREIHELLEEQGL